MTVQSPAIKRSDLRRLAEEENPTTLGASFMTKFLWIFCEKTEFKLAKASKTGYNYRVRAKIY